jgi:hypothetical protein
MGQLWQIPFYFGAIALVVVAFFAAVVALRKFCQRQARS